jgi:hypothetical protein
LISAFLNWYRTTHYCPDCHAGQDERGKGNSCKDSNVLAIIGQIDDSADALLQRPGLTLCHSAARFCIDDCGLCVLLCSPGLRLTGGSISDSRATLISPEVAAAGK